MGVSFTGSETEFPKLYFTLKLISFKSILPDGKQGLKNGFHSETEFAVVDFNMLKMAFQKSLLSNMAIKG